VEAACAASAAPLDPATAALSREVAELKEQVAALIAAGNAQPAGEAMADMRRQLAALQREHAPEEPPIEPTSAEVERERRLQMAELEADFWQESANAKWSNEASTAVLEALETEDTDQIEVRSLECRSQTCRVELASDVPEALNGLPVLLLKLAKTLPNAVASQVENADGSRSTVLYMTTKANGAPSPQG
jgi:hypothetical protein